MDDDYRCEWVNVSSGTGPPGTGSLEQMAVKRQCLYVCVAGK